MDEQRLELKWTLLKEFVEICDNNHIWYSLDKKLLLYAINNVEEEIEDDFEVMMTFESYEKLKTLHSKFVLDNCKHNLYHSQQIKFQKDCENIEEEQPFIKINLLLPTKAVNVKKLFTTKYKMKNWACNLKLNSTVSHLIWNIPFFRWNYKQLINLIHEEIFEGFIVIGGTIDKAIKKTWIPNVNYQTKKVFYKNLYLKVFNEANVYLANIYDELLTKTSEEDN
ncbi:hypothetical protein [[Mycoplasma] anseris]|uniref:Uncharacterized protein n=1 Tax=[Mycoplasma] anseris TaxID=92400 RepID=A0A2Z4NDK8_9BACT|nr:hypothetical protein [[Mycoplasma] anseris]AWX69629.1 hypothetical protein DP065_02650 [[Mycoplasma] anseris]